MSWESNVRKVVPYVPGEQPNKDNMVKLNTNECPYPPAPGVESALREMDSDAFRLYPDPGANVLLNELSEYYGVDKDQIFVGVGSDDVLAMAFLTFFNSGKPILFPDVTYSFYDVWAELYKIPYKTCALDESWHIKPEDFKQENGGVIFPNPNAPTGLMESMETVEEIIKANPDVIVIVDEAYVDFGGVSALPLVDKYENLLVVQTFSKSRAMAGMRIGFAFGSKKLIKYLNDAKFSFNSYTMNRPSLILGVESLKDKEYFAYRAYFAQEEFVTAAAAFETSVIGMIPMNIIMQLIKENNNLAWFFIKQLSIDLGIADERTVNLTQKHIRGHLAESLLFLKESYGLEEDGCTLSIYLSREDLANLSNIA